jgi:uncharacterized alkaline shock family protein YloU
MTAFWKFILFLYNLLLMAFGAGLIIVGTDISRAVAVLQSLSQPGWQRIALCLVGVLIIFIGLAMILFSLASSSSAKTASIQLASGQGGQVSVSVDAIRTMVGKAISQVPGVRELKTTISDGARGVRITSNLSIIGDDTFVNLSNQVQRAVKEYLTQVGGLRVEEVVVLISESAAPVKLPQAEPGEGAAPEAAAAQGGS